MCNRILYTVSLEALASGQKWQKDVQITIKGIPLAHSLVGKRLNYNHSVK